MLYEKERGRSYAVCTLDTPEKKYEVERLGMKKEPLLVEITTRRFHDIKKLSEIIRKRGKNPRIIRTVHYARTKKIRVQLRQGYEELLKTYNVQYNILKYKVVLK